MTNTAPECSANNAFTPPYMLSEGATHAARRRTNWQVIPESKNKRYLMAQQPKIPTS